MKHPLERLSAPQQRRLFWVSLALTLTCVIVFAVSGAALTTASAPQGIVSLQMAGSVRRAEAVLAGWDTTARSAAAFGLGFDYLFMPLYATSVALGCLMAQVVLRRARWPLASWGVMASWGVWLAALFDALENFALTVEMLSGVTPPWPQMAWICALLKFALLAAGLVYAFYGLAARLGQSLS